MAIFNSSIWLNYVTNYQRVPFSYVFQLSPWPPQSQALDHPLAKKSGASDGKFWGKSRGKAVGKMGTSLGKRTTSMGKPWNMEEKQERIMALNGYFSGFSHGNVNQKTWKTHRWITVGSHVMSKYHWNM